MSFDGTWNLVIATPMGNQEAVAELSSDGGALSGTQSAQGNTVDIYEGSVDGDSATWKVDITVPFPMTLTFTAELDGDAMTGQANPGVFPPSPFKGTRA